MAAEVSKFSVLWKDPTQQKRFATKITGFDSEPEARRFALDQREKGMTILAFLTREAIIRKDRLEEWLDGGR